MKKSMVVILALIASSGIYAAQVTAPPKIIDISKYPLAADTSGLVTNCCGCFCCCLSCVQCLSGTSAAFVCCVCYAPELCLKRAAETFAGPVRILLKPFEEFVGAARFIEVNNNTYVNQQPNKQSVEISQQQQGISQQQQGISQQEQLLTDALSTTVQ
jgi:hypothetical protein